MAAHQAQGWFICLLLMLGSSCCNAADWAYEGTHGPSHWEDDYHICGQNRQSPINIVTSDAVPDSCLEPLTMVNYDDTTDMAPRLRNNGHTVQVDLDGINHRIKGGRLPANYKLAQFHFHWGSNNQQGSEHTVDGTAYPLEMHMVHYSTEYSTLLDAATEAEGLAVLGFFFQVVTDDNEAFDDIITTMDDVQYKDENVSLPAFSVRDLLPSDLSDYYRYPGSLTTPGCYQSVIWTVFDEKIQISQAQLDKFRTLFEEEESESSNEHIVDNFRPVQNLNSRVVYTSIGAGSDVLTPSSHVINMAAFIAIATVAKWHS